MWSAYAALVMKNTSTNKLLVGKSRGMRQTERSRYIFKTTIKVCLGQGFGISTGFVYFGMHLG
jgi:Na+-driven multidrug efflux pump